jgi:hypothetical protein
MDVTQPVVKRSSIPHVSYDDARPVPLRRIPMRGEEPWEQSWQSLILGLKAERVRREKGHAAPSDGWTELTHQQTEACSSGYSAIRAWQRWQDEARAAARRKEMPPSKPDWPMNRLRASLEAWNATFHDGDGPAPDPNDWNPRSYAGPPEEIVEWRSDPDDPEVGIV